MASAVFWCLLCTELFAAPLTIGVQQTRTLTSGAEVLQLEWKPEDKRTPESGRWSVDLVFGQDIVAQDSQDHSETEHRHTLCFYTEDGIELFSQQAYLLAVNDHFAVNDNREGIYCYQVIPFDHSDKTVHLQAFSEQKPALAPAPADNETGQVVTVLVYPETVEKQNNVQHGLNSSLTDFRLVNEHPLRRNSVNGWWPFFFFPFLPPGNGPSLLYSLDIQQQEDEPPVWILPDGSPFLADDESSQEPQPLTIHYVDASGNTRQKTIKGVTPKHIRPEQWLNVEYWHRRLLADMPFCGELTEALEQPRCGTEPWSPPVEGINSTSSSTQQPPPKSGSSGSTRSTTATQGQENTRKRTATTSRPEDPEPEEQQHTRSFAPCLLCNGAPCEKRLKTTLEEASGTTGKKWHILEYLSPDSLTQLAIQAHQKDSVQVVISVPKLSWCILQYLDVKSIMQLTLACKEAYSMVHRHWHEWVSRQSDLFFGTGSDRIFWRQRAAEYFGSEEALARLRKLAGNGKTGFIPDKSCAPPDPLYLATLYRLARRNPINLCALTWFSADDGKDRILHITDLTRGCTAITTFNAPGLTYDINVHCYQKDQNQWKYTDTLARNPCEIKRIAGLNSAYETETPDNGIRQLAAVDAQDATQIWRQPCTTTCTTICTNKSAWERLPDITTLKTITALVWLNRSRLLVGTAAGHIHVMALEDTGERWEAECLLNSDKGTPVSDLALMPCEQLACAFIDGIVRIWSWSARDFTWKLASSFMREAQMYVWGRTEGVHIEHTETEPERVFSLMATKAQTGKFNGMEPLNLEHAKKIWNPYLYVYCPGTSWRFCFGMAL